MDEYLRSRYKGVDGGDSAEPPKPASDRYAPPQPERLYRQPARPMFPVNPRPHQAAQPAKPALAQHHPAPTKHHAPSAHERPIAKPHARPKRHFLFVKILVMLLVLGLAVGGSYYYLAYVKSPTPIPQKLVDSAGFPIYYPSTQTGSYLYQAGSVDSQKGLFTYKIADGSNGVIVNEQTRPGTKFNPAALPKFKPINVSDGTAVIGISSGVMTIVYDTPTTLINMTALNNISRSDMISIAQNLSPIKRKTGLLQVFNIGFIGTGVVVESAIYKN